MRRERQSRFFRYTHFHADNRVAGSVQGAVAGVVGIEVGVVSGVFNLESSGVDAPEWRPRHEEH